MRHRHPPDPAERVAAIIGMILIAWIMLTSPQSPAMHGAEIAHFYDAR